VRLKRYLEMRGADVGSRERILALPALFVGLFYDSVSLDAAYDLIKPWRDEDRQKLRRDVPRLALAADVAGRPLREIAGEVLAIARAGLSRRARREGDGRDETIYLAPLEESVATGRVPAQDWLARYETEWGGRVDPIFEEAAY
jgi:glutamate--cysteine ligase